MNSSRFSFGPRHAVALAASIALTPAVLAQTAAALDSAASAPATTLPEVVVTGNPLGRSDIAVPVSVLSGDELVLRRGSSLGETLNGQPGVSSSYFGPNANRPVIRGLDGDRVRLLTNAGASLDASSLSFDHAVPIDPLIVERLEVLRGPGALLYGGSAVGGVVNALDNRIPKERMTGITGAAELRVGGAADERGGAALVETGNGRFALHADAFGRETSDLRVPSHTPIADGEALPAATRVRNSASRARGGALGGSAFFAGGRIGLSVDHYDSTYGIVAEPDVTIEMERDHAGLAFDWSSSDGPLRALRTTLNHTRYGHEEIEGDGAVGTTFDSTGDEARVEVEHAAIGPLRGVVGLQWEDFDFSALGEEAFVPATRTRKQAVFALEELGWALGTLTGGVRLEKAQVDSAGDTDPAEVKFGPARQRSFTLQSASLSNLFKLNPQWSLSGGLSYTERAPTYFELYANGVHVATSAFERGDPGLQQERGTNVDLALQWNAGPNHLRVGAFATRFSRFISLEATGVTIDETNDEGEVDSFPEFAFQAVRARLDGVEIDGRQRVLDGSWTLDASGKLDLTRATNRDTGEPLPRIAPLRLLVGLDATHGAWGGRVEVDHAARQDRVPATDAPTPSYTLVNLSLMRRFALGDSDGLWFVKLDNVGNTLATNAATIQTVRGLSPLPGRSLKAGVRLAF
jgi:iron complex outermembrane receptor protein